MNLVRKGTRKGRICTFADISSYRFHRYRVPFSTTEYNLQVLLRAKKKKKKTVCYFLL